MDAPLLTVAIPTYNRSALLDLCLSQMTPQVAAHGDRVELLVSDNASSDDTAAVVARHQAEVPIRHIQNAENIGPDANFAQCLQKARGKYVLIFGDDDVLLDGALDKLLPLLAEGNPGVVNLRGYAFREDFRAERPRKAPRRRVMRFRNPRAFAGKVNVMFTFISGNVINKSLLPEGFDVKPYLATQLVQLSWTFKAALGAKENVFVDDYLVAAKAENSGGYKLCQVFGVNMNRICRIMEAEGEDPGFFKAINRRTLCGFFPRWILNVREQGERFTAENHFETLRPIYRAFPVGLWALVWPAATWPLALAKPWIRISRHWLKLVGLA